MNDALKTHVAKYTRDLGSNQIQILNTYFIFISSAVVMFDGHIIHVNVIRNEMAKVECIEFLDIPILRASVGPIHFISLNRIYNFDESLHVSSENFIFTKDYFIFEKIIRFIERYGGNIIDSTKECILFTIDQTNEICINIMYLSFEDGFIVEVSKTQEYIPEYDTFASNFIKEFKPMHQTIAIGLASF